MKVKVRKAAKDYPAFGVVKGQTIYKWREGGAKHVSLTDPRTTDTAVVALETAVVEAPEAVVEETNVVPFAKSDADAGSDTPDASESGDTEAVSSVAKKTAKRSPRVKGLPVTENEMGLLKAIITSEYGDSPLDQVWTECVWGYEGQKNFGGTVASLVKKGFIVAAVFANKKENTLRLTIEGIRVLDPSGAALMEAHPEASFYRENGKVKMFVREDA